MKIKKIFIVIMGIIGIALAFLGTRAQFSRTAKEKLIRAAEVQVLRFESQLSAEIKLVLQMTKSPIIKQFLENPEDEFVAAAAMEELKRYQDSFLSKSSFWIGTYDNKFYSDCQFAYVVDPEDPAQYWYKMSLYETEVYNFNINYNPDLKQTNLWVNACVRNEKGTPIAVAGTGIPIGNFINSLYSSIKDDNTISMYMFNSLSEVTGALDQDLVEAKAHIGDVVPALLKYQDYSDTTRFVSSFKSEYILEPISSIGWTLVLECPFNAEAFFQSASMPFGLLLLIVVVIAIASISIRLFRPLNALNKTVSDLSSGSADLRKRIKIDLTGCLPVVVHLVNGFNAFIEKIQGTVHELMMTEDHIETSRVRLSEGTAESVKSIEEISSGIDEFNHKLKQQTSSIQQTASAVEQISSNIGSLNNMVSTQGVAVSDASSAVEQMLGNIKSVNGSVAKLTNSFSALETKTMEGVTKHENMNAQINEIKEQSVMLAEANKVISAIASQTNLLAMNAAIEAAHAGEAGKGFSVVADEIRKLSENSSSQSKAISKELKEIQKSIETVVGSAAAAGTAFREVADRMSETDSLVKQISHAMDEQETGSKQISDSLLTLNSSSAEVRSASKEMSEGSKTILGEVKVLKEITSEMDIGMDALDQKGKVLKETQGNLATLSQDVDEAIGKMHSSLGMFQV